MTFAFRILIFFFLGYGALVALVYLRQSRMLYFPDTRLPPEAALPDLGLQSWPHADSSSYMGLYGSFQGEVARGLVIVFHGNAGAAWQRVHYVRALAPLGFNVVLAEYPGYGGRGGEHSEVSFVSDARRVVERAYMDFGGPVYLWGESLGCGVVGGVAADSPVDLSGIILTTPWDSLPALAQALYWYFPAKLIVRDQYNNISNLQSYDGRVAVAIAGRDEIIGRKHSMRLYDRLTGEKRLWMFETAGHNNWPTAPTEPWWGEVMDFLSSAQDG